jgi:hypothetical protein
MGALMLGTSCKSSSAPYSANGCSGSSTGQRGFTREQSAQKHTEHCKLSVTFGLLSRPGVARLDGGWQTLLLLLLLPVPLQNMLSVPVPSSTYIVVCFIKH